MFLTSAVTPLPRMISSRGQRQIAICKSEGWEVHGWATGGDTLILHWDGSAWNQMPSPAGGYLPAKDATIVGLSNTAAIVGNSPPLLITLERQDLQRR